MIHQNIIFKIFKAPSMHGKNMLTLTVSVPRFTKLRCNSYRIHHLVTTKAHSTRLIQPSSPWQDRMLQVLQNQALDCNQQLLSNSHRHLKDFVGCLLTTKIHREKLWKKTIGTKKVSRKLTVAPQQQKIRCQGASLSVALGEVCHTAHALTDAIALAAATRPVAPQGHTAIRILHAVRIFLEYEKIQGGSHLIHRSLEDFFEWNSESFFKDGLSMMFFKHLQNFEADVGRGHDIKVSYPPLHTKEGRKAWTLASVPPEKSKARKKQK